MKRTLLTSLLVFGFVGFALSAMAQDKVKLASGKFITGDIVAILEGGAIEIVTPEAKLVTIAADQVADVRRGAPLTSRVNQKLAEIDARNPEALFKVASWAFESRGLRKDGKRLAARVVAFKPDHAQAREMLGHVLALGTWYPDSRSAFLAVKDRMKDDGYEFFKKGWIKKELLPFLKEAPADWVLWQNFYWRSLTEVRKERGDKLWKKEWYTGEDAKLVETLERIEKMTGDDCHAGQAGTCKVYCYLGREEAREAAERQQKARTWFIETFDVMKRRPLIRRFPAKIDWVLSGEAAFLKFLSGRVSGRQYALSRKTGNHAAGFFYCGHLGKEAWKWSLVSHMGLAMMRAYWVGGPIPAWIMVASGHQAEMAVMGDVRVQWVHIGAYDQDVKIPQLRGHAMKEIKAAVREYYQNQPMPGLRVMMSKDMNELTQELDTLGVVYLSYLMENHKETWLDFLTKPVLKANNVRERFEHHFKMTFEEMDQKFRKWLGL